MRLYRNVNELEATREDVRTEVRKELVKLQQGDRENGRFERAVELSWREFEKTPTICRAYALTSDWKASNDALGPLCERLASEGVAEMSDGALCIFFRDIPALEEKPMIIRKSDGGFLYSTTDLATIEYRVRKYNPSAIWYVVGAPQALHFQQVFAAARRMGVTADLQHVAFGSILGEDRKIMRTRAGETIGLAEPLEKRIGRARGSSSRKPSLNRGRRRRSPRRSASARSICRTLPNIG